MSEKHIAIINKPYGLSSSDVVIKCRNAYSRAVNSKIKCGHMGTLDPMATGVLIIAFGNATRLLILLLKKKKRISLNLFLARNAIQSTPQVN